jgi:NADP-dependent 3-hydroxy acid dehydrogenase YdfG
MTKKINRAKETLKNENLSENVDFYKIDLVSELKIEKMIKYLIKRYDFIDVILNNATTVFLGEIENVDNKLWEISYKVNFRVPLLLAKKIIPIMKNKNKGIIVFVSSSGASPYMGAYEIFKTAQVELANTLYCENNKTDISIFTISHGLVKTETAINCIKFVSEKIGVSTDEFYKMNEEHILEIEEVGLHCRY